MKPKRMSSPGLYIAAALLLAAWLVCDSKYNLQSTEYDLSFDSLPEEFEGFRIVQLSDLHGSSFGKGNLRLASLVSKQRPDIIVITGDLAENDAQLAVADSLLEKLSGIAPVYFVSGNHEWSHRFMPSVAGLLEKHGVRYLKNEYDTLSRGTARIVIAGVDDPLSRADMALPDDFVENMRQQYPDDFTLLLGHRNYWVQEYPYLPVDLVLSGHAHGGIVRLPFIGGLLNTNRSFGAEYESGIYRGEQMKMVVSRGLGNSIPVPRVFNRPELVTVILHSE